MEIIDPDFRKTTEGTISEKMLVGYGRQNSRGDFQK